MISPEDLDEVRAHNPDHMNGDTIDKLVARVEELEGALTEARKELLRNEIGHPRFAVFAALSVINRVLEGTE